jgi:serine/threonine-protein kinase
MFIALTGQQVRQADTPNEELLLAMTQRPPSIGDMGATLPLALVELVDRALAFEQDDRWPDARAMQTAVRTVQSMLGSDGSLPIATEISSTRPVDSASPMTLLTPTPRPMVSSSFGTRVVPLRRRRAVLVVLGAVATVVVLLLLSRSRDERSNQRAVAAAPPAEPPAPTFSDPEQPVVDPPLPAPPETMPPVAQEESTLPASPTRPKGDRPPIAKPPPPPPRPRIEAHPAPVPAPTVAPAAEAPLPLSTDPLDRRR